MKTLTTLSLLLALAAPAAAQPAPPVPMDAWESQVLGSLFGTFCGYFPDRLTTIGITLKLKSHAQCREKFERLCVPRS